jgi:hypothetical protein
MNFVNNDAIPTAKRWTGALTGGVLPGIRDPSDAQEAKAT